MNTNIIRKHFFFKGRVQGVGFRYRAQNAASLYSVTGWVKKSLRRLGRNGGSRH